MYEPTHGGTWFRWGALDRGEKWLVGGSLVTIVSSTVLTLRLTEGTLWAYELGYRLGSGGAMPTRRGPDVPPHLDAPLTIAAVLCAAVGVLLWALFSRRQDELFNRVQNRSYGIGSTATLGLLALWLAGNRLGMLPLPAAGGVILLWLILCGGVWMRDARRHWGAGLDASG